MCCRLDLNSVLARLRCYTSKDPLKRDFLVVYLTTFFAVRKFKNTSAMRVIFFSKMFEIESKFRKCKKNLEKKFFVSEIIASEDLAINCLCYPENTCHWQSICEQTVLRFCISLREIFSNRIFFTLINKYGKRAFDQISTVFRRVYHVTCQRVLWNRTS